VDGRKKFSAPDDSFKGKAENFGKIFEGEPYEIDREASAMLGVDQQYLDIIRAGKAELDN
jgi:hypothetical protein